MVGRQVFEAFHGSQIFSIIQVFSTSCAALLSLFLQDLCNFNQTASFISVNQFKYNLELIHKHLLRSIVKRLAERAIVRKVLKTKRMVARTEYSVYNEWVYEIRGGECQDDDK